MPRATVAPAARDEDLSDVAFLETNRPEVPSFETSCPVLEAFALVVLEPARFPVAFFLPAVAMSGVYVRNELVATRFRGRADVPRTTST